MQHSDFKHIEWHDSAWRQLDSLGASLPHALLLTGPEGIGKSAFGVALVARLLCESPITSQACGQCPSCRWLAGDNHPDFRHLIPAADVDAGDVSPDGERKKASRQILLDQVRALEDFVFVGGHRNGARVVLIEPAEAMNQAAQNALLKILEEPPSSVYFILISTQWRQLLPTIRSRCRTMPLARPSASEARKWLEGNGDSGAMSLLPILGTAPLLAQAESERGRAPILLGVLASLAEPGRDPLALAGRWQNQLQLKSDAGLTMESFIQLLQKWVVDLALFKVSGRCRTQGYKVDSAKQLTERASVGGLIRCYNDLMKFRALASHPLNPQLLLEDIAERYLRALASARS